MQKTQHRSVLLKETIKLLDIQKGVYIDCTLGGGGHTLEIVKKLQSCGGGRILSIEVDKAAIKRFEKQLGDSGWKKDKSTFTKKDVRINIAHDNFENLKKILKGLEIYDVNGVVVDLGLSSDQIEDSTRGFSYMEDGPLDMRMDKGLKVKAEDLVNGLYKNELEKLFKGSDERYAKSIAKGIVTERKVRRIETTKHLVQIIRKVLSKQSFRQVSLPFVMGGKQKKCSRPIVRAYWIKPAMRVFQALRIAVNSELSSLQNMLPQALEALQAGGNFVCISFHSGEDRIVKRFIKDMEVRERIKILTKKPKRPSKEEMRVNIRSRSAKLRAYRKLK